MLIELNFILLKLCNSLLVVNRLSIEPSLKIFNSFHQSFLLTLKDKALLIWLFSIARVLGHFRKHLADFGAFPLAFGLELLVLLIQRLNYGHVLLDLSLMLVLQPLHLLLEQRVLRIQLFVRSVNLQGFLNFLLHIVAILFEFRNDLLLGVGSLFRLFLAFF